MSRSKHTDPPTMRAARRLRAPREDRNAGILDRRLGRMLKETGAVAEPEPLPSLEPVPARPRVVVQPPRPGFHHPAGKPEILEVLRAIGPLAIYGVRTIELTRRHRGRAAAALTFGSYRVPGTIVLYEQPLPPWRLPGFVASRTARRLESAGAILTPLPGAGATLVDWPDGTLRHFMLEEVLLHEIGHHVLQHYTGKRPVRIARTRDHEAFAARFAEKERAALLKRSRAGP
jgi:hypothetical protein